MQTEKSSKLTKESIKQLKKEANQIIEKRRKDGTLNPYAEKYFNDLESRFLKILEDKPKTYHVEILKIFFYEVASIVLGDGIKSPYDELPKYFDNILKVVIKRYEEEVQNERETPLPDILRMSQSHSINTLKHVVTGASNGRISENIKVTIDDYEGTLTAKQGKRKGFETEINIKDFALIKPKLKNEKLSKLLDMAFYFLDRQSHKCYVKIPIEAYIRYTGRENTPNNKKDLPKRELKPLLKILHNFSITSNTKNKGKNYSFSYVRPFSRAEYKKGLIIIGFDMLFVESICKHYFDLPVKIGSLKGATYYMASYIFLYAKQVNKTEFNISYDALYQYSGLPRYKEVTEGSYKRHIGRAIIDPFSKALLEIKETLSNSIEIEESEYGDGSWQDFKKAKLKVKITMQGFQSNVISINEARKKAFKQTEKQSKSKNAT